MIPVIFIHRMNGKPPPEYLLTALRQARSYNTKIVLLSDVKACLPGVEFCPLSVLFKEAEAFTPHYRHMSSNPHGFELICFQRHFAVEAFMRARGYNRAFICDSDVMVYRDMSEVGPLVLEGNLTALSTMEHQPKYRWVSSGCSAFWTLDGIRKFCDLIMETYTTTGGIAKLEEKWNWHRRTKSPGGVCDMTLLWFFTRRYPTGNIVQVLKDGSTFDDNINSDEGMQPGEYEMDSGIKRLEWVEGAPYGFNRRLGQWVRFNTLHFQGGSKRRMERFLVGGIE